MSRPAHRTILLLILAGLVIVLATRWYLRRPSQLNASQGHHADLFGYSLALANDRLAISAYGDDAGGEKSGAIYLFHREGSNWREAGKLLAPNAQPYTYFGASLALTDDTLAASTCRQESFSRGGSVEIFSQRNGVWQPSQTIPLGGCSRAASLLALKDGLLAVGQANARTVRLFRQEASLWQPVATLKPEAAFHYSITDPFAHLKTMALSHNRVVMGLADSLGVFVFERQEDGRWREVQQLTVTGSRSEFGAALTISEGIILVGDPLAERCHAGQCETLGAVYLFAFDGESWQLADTLLGKRPFSWFGRSAILHDNELFIGAPMEVDGAFGAVYHLVNCDGQWQQQARLTAGSNPRADYAISRGWAATQTLIQRRDPRVGKIWDAARGGFLHPVLLPFGPAMAADETAVFIGTNRFVGNSSPPVYQFEHSRC